MLVVVVDAFLLAARTADGIGDTFNVVVVSTYDDVLAATAAAVFATVVMVTYTDVTVLPLDGS